MLTSTFYTLYPFILLAMNAYSLYLAKKTSEFSLSKTKNPFEYSHGIFHDPLNKSDFTKTSSVVKRILLVHLLFFAVYLALNFIPSEASTSAGKDFVLGMMFFFNVEFILNLFSIYTQYRAYSQPGAFSGKIKVNSGILLRSRATEQLLYATIWTLLLIATGSIFFLGGTLIAIVVYVRNRKLGTRLINVSQKTNPEVK